MTALTMEPAILGIKNKIKTMIPFKATGIIVAGGCFASFLHGEKPKDIDVFVLDDPEVKKTAREIIDPNGNYAKLGLVGDAFPEMNEKEKKDYIEALNHRKRNNANIEDVVNVSIGGQRAQFIFTKYKTRRELIDHFDFVHTKVSYDTGEDKLYISEKTYDAIFGKRLIVADQAKGVEQWRIYKFKSRGWLYVENA